MPIALLVPDQAGKDEFVAEGYGIGRRDVMYNDFIIVGSASDLAHVRDLKEVHKPFSQVASIGAIFATRGDYIAAKRLIIRPQLQTGMRLKRKSRPTWTA